MIDHAFIQRAFSATVDCWGKCMDWLALYGELVCNVMQSTRSRVRYMSLSSPVFPPLTLVGLYMCVGFFRVGGLHRWCGLLVVGARTFSRLHCNPAHPPPPFLRRTIHHHQIKRATVGRNRTIQRNEEGWERGPLAEPSTRAMDEGSKPRSTQ